MRILTFSVTLCLISLSWAATREEDIQAVPVETVVDNTEESVPEDRGVFCPSGWFASGSRCYLFVNSRMSWITAEKHCANQQGALASVQNPQEYRFLQSLAKVAGQSSAWIGGFYFQDSWMWMDRAGFYYENFASKNPTSTHQCIQMHSESAWTNSKCSVSLPFFCVIDPNAC